VEPRLSVSQITTLNSSFADDVRSYRDAGLQGIGIWELKLPDGGDAEALELFEASGLESAAAVPGVTSILPLPLLGGPEDPAERVDAYCRSLERLAVFHPCGLVLLTGTAEGREADDARAVVVDGLKTIGAEAARLGLRIGLEPYQRDGAEPWTIVSSIPEAIDLLHDAGDPEAIGIQFDTWHLWNTETLYDDIATQLHRFTGVHVSDVRSPTRGWCDRALPGDGIADVPRILAALADAGWDGLYDIEIFSDDGTFGVAYPDSIWAAEPAQVLRSAREAFDKCFPPAPAGRDERRQTVKESR
jgi:sugar phosphate isomerase/epimerase